MSCRDFAGVLEGLLDGTLEREAHARCIRHVASCRSCRELVEPMGLALAPVGTEPPASLLEAVLARTSHETRRTRWAETWHQWMLRPRFASEAAYVAVVVLSLSFVTLDRSGVQPQYARARVVLNDLRSEAGILLDRATSLWEKEKP
jgi:predicted anti-sigma-YlaC factor YlaD